MLGSWVSVNIGRLKLPVQYSILRFNIFLKQIKKNVLQVHLLAGLALWSRDLGISELIWSLLPSVGHCLIVCRLRR